MTFKNFMIIKAIVCLGFGIILVFVPGVLMDFLGASLGPGGTFLGRVYGASLFGTLMLTWFGRNVAESEARRPILLHLFVYDAIGIIVTVLAVMSGVLNTLGWGIVAVYLVIALGSGYLLTMKPSTM
jgi:hypothetical protein